MGWFSAIGSAAASVIRGVLGWFGKMITIGIVFVTGYRSGRRAERQEGMENAIETQESQLNDAANRPRGRWGLIDKLRRREF